MQIYRILPYFNYIFISPLKWNDMEFQSDHHIPNITIPILILHAVDDPVIPFFLGQKVMSLKECPQSVLDSNCSCFTSCSKLPTKLGQNMPNLFTSWTLVRATHTSISADHQF